MSIITLTTDFGLDDEYVAVMKGTILGIAPEVTLVDISHAVAPQNVRQALYLLRRAAPYFPPGTVHLAVVDPGVGSPRRALAVQAGEAWYVGPDNGLFTAALALPGARAYLLDRPAYWRPTVSRTFHGRDIFAPVAAHLAHGVPGERIGTPIDDALRLSVPLAMRRPGGHIAGEVVYADHFGNLITNIPAGWLHGGPWQCMLGDLSLGRLQTAYAEVEPGQLLALISSGDTVEIAVRDGSAADRLGTAEGLSVVLVSESAA